MCVCVFWEVRATWADCTNPLCFLSFFLSFTGSHDSKSTLSNLNTFGIFFLNTHTLLKLMSSILPATSLIFVQTNLFSAPFSGELQGSQNKNKKQRINKTEVRGLTVRTGLVCRSCCSWCRCRAHRQRNCPGPTSA